jgi:glyoxylase-like metal-dependent hydrolase (beta-lactamase superfamily II)
MTHLTNECFSEGSSVVTMRVMKIHHLDTGTLCPLGARFVNGKGGLFSRARMVCHCLLLETPTGLVLVDGGIGMGDIADPDRLGWTWVRQAQPKLDASQTALAQVRALGFSPRDVRDVVLTHLDLDHAGAIPDFPEARVHVHAREIDAATRRAGRLERRRYVPAQIPGLDRVRAFEDGGERWFGFEGVRAFDDRDPDVLLVPLRGHTAGHTGVAVRDGSRWLLHAGDAYFFHAQMHERPDAPLVLQYFQRQADHDRAARVQNQERVRELALSRPDEVTVFCAHDPVELDRFVGTRDAAPGALDAARSASRPQAS